MKRTIVILSLLLTFAIGTHFGGPQFFGQTGGISQAQAQLNAPTPQLLLRTAAPSKSGFFIKKLTEKEGATNLNSQTETVTTFEEKPGIHEIVLALIEGNPINKDLSRDSLSSSVLDKLATNYYKIAVAVFKEGETRD